MPDPTLVGPNQSPSAWDTAAPGYAEFIGSWQDYAREALRLVPVKAGDVVLDVAAGPGTLAVPAAAQASRVVAVDFSPGMLEELVKRAAGAGVTNIERAVMDAEALTFADASFDAAYCLFAFMFFPHREKAFREMLRVLKPGGHAVIATWATLEKRPIMKVAFDAMAEALPQLPLPAKGDLQTLGECLAEMSAAGFKEVKAHPFTASFHVESPQRYLEWVTRSAAPFAALRKKLGEAVWAEGEKALLAAIRKRIPEHGIDLSAEAILTVGTR
jgi:SAM-dependent methyltransferase